DPFRATRDDADSVRQTSELLAASRVAVYTVYAAAQPSAIDSSRDQSSETGMGASLASKNDAMATARTIADQGSMRTIAEQTGGQYFDSYKLKEAMEKAVENGSSYYTIGYIPAGKL